MPTSIKLPTWSCSDCGYVQDFDPSVEVLMSKHFPGVPLNHCPACFSGKNDSKVKKNVAMSKENNPHKKVTLTIIGEDEVDSIQVETNEKDQNGNKILRFLTNNEKTDKINKIRSDIAKYKLLEDK